jgi:pimeloyl-ACP methyl ester carboxylesterase
MLSESFKSIPYNHGLAERLHIISAGDGPIILILHGWIASAAQWRQIIAGLPDGYTYLAVDLPGFGGSPPLPKEHINLVTYTEIISGLISSITESNKLYAIVGDSLGAILALRLLIAGRLNETHLFLCGCPSDGLPGIFKLSRVRGLVALYLRAIQMLPPSIANPLIKICSLVTLKNVRHIDTQMLSDIRRTDPLTAELTAKELCNPIIDDIPPQKIGDRCLIARGEKDIFVSAKSARALAERLGGDYFEFKGTRHNPKIESESKFIKNLCDFINR